MDCARGPWRRGFRLSIAAYAKHLAGVATGVPAGAFIFKGVDSEEVLIVFVDLMLVSEVSAVAAYILVCDVGILGAFSVFFGGAELQGMAGGCVVVAFASFGLLLGGYYVVVSKGFIIYAAESAGACRFCRGFSAGLV